MMMMGDGGMMQRVVEPKIPTQNRRCRRRRGGRGLADWDVGGVAVGDEWYRGPRYFLFWNRGAWTISALVVGSGGWRKQMQTKYTHTLGNKRSMEK